MEINGAGKRRQVWAERKSGVTPGLAPRTAFPSRLGLRVPPPAAAACRAGWARGRATRGDSRRGAAPGSQPAPLLRDRAVRRGRQVGFERRGKRNRARGAGLEQPAVAVGSRRRVIPEGDLRDPLTRGVLWSGAVGALPEAGRVIGLCGSPAAQLCEMGGEGERGAPLPGGLCSAASRSRRVGVRAVPRATCCAGGGKGSARAAVVVSTRLGTALSSVRSRRPGTALRLSAAPRLSAIRVSPHLPPGAAPM